MTIPTLKIGKFEWENALLLAPMEGITDLPFRIICKHMGADLVYTEFISSEAIIRDVDKSMSKMIIDDSERPAAVQIFGARVEAMTEAAKICEDQGADIIDLNYGCWVKKVVNNNSGAAYLKDINRMAETTRAVAEAVSVPVTVKTRLGWDDENIVIVEATKLLNETGAQALTVHCRTRNMGMKGHADWSWIPHIKEVAEIPIILNGDVTTPIEAKKAFDTTGCDAVMIGRAAVGNPFLFRDVRNFLDNGIGAEEITPETRIEYCKRHLNLALQYRGFPRGMYEFRKHYSGYLKGLYYGANVRQELVEMETKEEIFKKLDEYLEFLNNRPPKPSYSPIETNTNS